MTPDTVSCRTSWRGRRLGETAGFRAAAEQLDGEQHRDERERSSKRSIAKAVRPTGPSTPEMGSTSAVDESASANPSATAACTV